MKIKMSIVVALVAASVMTGCGGGTVTTQDTRGSSSGQQSSESLTFAEYSGVFAPVLDNLNPKYTNFSATRSSLFDGMETSERVADKLYFIATNTETPFGYIESYRFNGDQLVISTSYTEEDTQFSDAYDVSANTDGSLHLSGSQYIPSDIKFSKPMDAATLQTLYASENQNVSFSPDAKGQFIIYGNGMTKVELLLTASAYKSVLHYYRVATGKIEETSSSSQSSSENFKASGNSIVMIITHVDASVCKSVDPYEQSYEGYMDYADFLSKGGKVELNYYTNTTKNCTSYSSTAYCDVQDYANVGYGVSGNGSCVEIVTFP